MKSNVVHGVAYISLIAILIFAGVAWLRAHDAWVRAQVTEQAQEEIRKHATQDAQEAEQRREKAVSDLQAQAKKPATINTVTKLVTMPPRAHVEIEQSGNEPPHLAMYGDVQTNLDAIQSAEISCKICENNLTARETQLADSKLQIAALTKERDKFKSAAAGGHGFWGNLKHDLLVAGISFGAGYLSHR